MISIRSQRNQAALILIGIALYSIPTTFGAPDFSVGYGTVDSSESLNEPLKSFLYEEQVLHNKNLWPPGHFNSDIDQKYLPENRPRFPLSYFIIPEDSAKFLDTPSLSAEIRSQVQFTGKDGKKYFRMFVHPESYQHYKFLEGKFVFVGPRETEFLASPTSSYRSLLVWRKNSASESRPFIAKVSLDRNVIGSIDRLVSSGEIERSIANQKALEKIGREYLNASGLDIYPETAGLILDKQKFKEAPEKLGGMLIREIPETVLNGKKRFISFAALMSPERPNQPLIMEVIRKSGLSSEEFARKFLVEGFLNTYEKTSLLTGLGLEMHSQNLNLETEADLTPTGRFILRDFGGVWPDIPQMDRMNGPIENYLGKGNAEVFKLSGARSTLINGYVFYYRSQVFENLLNQIGRHDPKFTASKRLALRNELDAGFRQLVKKHLNLDLSEVPEILSDKKKNRVAKAGFANIAFPSERSVPVSRNIAMEFIQKKSLSKDWIQFSEIEPDSEFYLSGKVLYHTKSGKVAGFSLLQKEDEGFFSSAELKRSVYSPSEKSCKDLFRQFLRP